jgi:glycosyltransferase involved in cell wall biosynthesis
MSTITLIVPAYNEGPFIDRAIQSIRNQTVPFDEVILIDDHSTDGTTEKIRAQGDWIRIEHPDNRGVSAARNSGLEQATSDWVTFLDADDELLPDACEKMHEAINNWNGRADWIQFNHLRHYAKINMTVKKYWNDSSWTTVENLHEKRCWWGVWNKLIKRSAIKHNFNEYMRYGEDGIWVLEHILEGEDIRNIDQETVIRHFENPNSLTKSKTARQLETLENELRWLLKRYSDTDEPYENIKAITGCIDNMRANPHNKEIRK